MLRRGFASLRATSSLKKPVGDVLLHFKELSQGLCPRNVRPGSEAILLHRLYKLYQNCSQISILLLVEVNSIHCLFFKV